MNNNDATLIRLQSLLETTKILNSKQDTDRILDILLTKSLELIEGGDVGAIFLYNEKNNLLEMRAYKGMGNSVKDVKLLPGESMTGITFENKKPIFFSNSELVQKAMSTMRDNNTKLATDGDVVAANIHGSICCPLIYRDKTIGVLVIDNINNKIPLKKEDVEFLMAISIQATIAIINAQNLEIKIENNKKLEKYNEIIKNQRNKYRYSTSIHTRFTEMVLNGCTIYDIVAEIKKLIKRDVFIIDIFYKVTYNSITYIGIFDMVDKGVPKIITHLKENEKIEYFDADYEVSYHVFPITVSRETMGWLCVISNSSDLTELDIITIERGSTILALEFLKRNELSDMEQSLKGDFLDSLMLNNNPEYIKKCSHRYGFNINANHKIIIKEFSLFSEKNIDQNKYEKVIKKSLKNYYQIVNEKLKAFFPNSISLIKGHMIVIIIEIASREEKDKIDKFIDSFEKKCDSLHYTNFKKCRFKIGISNIFNGIDKFNQSYYNAIQALRMVKSYEKRENYVYYESLEVKKFLMNNNFDELRTFVDKILGPLEAYKNSSKNEFLNTLRVYLRSNCNWSETKNRLHIHGNTLTYRLNRISKILDMKLDNYNDRLRLQIAYEIIDLLHK